MMRFLRTLVKHWYLYLVPVIIIPLVVTLYGFNKLTLYESHANLYVEKPVLLSSDPTGWNPYLTAAENEAIEMQQQLAFQSFVAGVAAKTDLAQLYNLDTDAGKAQAYARLTPEIAIGAPGGPNVLVVSVSDKVPHLAQQIVVALLAYFQSYYQTHRLENDQQAQIFYSGELQTANAAVVQDTANIQEYCHAHQEACVPPLQIDPLLAELQGQLTLDQQSVKDLKSQLAFYERDEQVTDSSASSFFQVRDAPTAPKLSLDKKKLLVTYTGGGLAAALAVVALIVFIRTQLDRKVYGEDDLRIIEEDLGLTLGGGIVTLPVIAGMDAPAHASGDPDDALDGILVPVLTALPRLRAQDVRRELRKAVGVSPAALAGATRAEDAAEESEA
jgi:uncharacterized protein involved in exopolysaccharide biosynthesis